MSEPAPPPAEAGPGHLSWRSLWVETTGRLAGEAQHARWLCEEASGADGAAWLEVLDEHAGERGVARLDAMVARRLAGEPLQYVLGRWAFRHLDLMVDRRVLIPRPETEELVTLALDRLGDVAPRLVVDIGTGSGAIALSLAGELPLEGTRVWATDISPDALDVARANLAGLGRAAANVSLALGSLFDALPTELRGRFDLVVGNPPYVATGDDRLEAIVGEWEPPVALFGGGDGLAVLHPLVLGAVEWLRPGGWLLVEIGSSQGPEAAGFARSAGFDDVAVLADHARHDRYLTARRRA